MSFWRNYYHLTWGTKHRLPLLDEDIEAQVFQYIVHKSDELGIIVYAINGTEDHLHLIVAIPPQKRVSKIVKEIKGSSSHYINHVLRPDRRFGWQAGYGCLTIGEKQLSIAKIYVEKQKQHNKDRTTNRWLEHHQVDNAGPEKIKPQLDPSAPKINEDAGEYSPLGDMPF